VFRRFETVLSECLEAMRHGATVQDCLERFPRHARKLEPQLALAEKVSRTPLIPARPGAQEQAWRVLQKRVAEIKGGKRPVAVRVVHRSRTWVMPVAAVSIGVLTLAAATGGVLYASQEAQPDSPLYTVKLAGEDIRLWLVFDDERKAEILLDQSQQRMEEINATIREGNPVPENALSALHNRNERAEKIVSEHLDNTALRARLRTQAQEQEDRLIAIWTLVPVDSQAKYAQVVANLHNTLLDPGTSDAQVAELRPEELSGGILTIAGQAEMNENGTWTIGGVEVRIDDRTIGGTAIQPGTSASILAARASNGRLLALTANSLGSGVITGSFVSGKVEQITDEGITVAGQFFRFSDTTLQTSRLEVGEKVQITVQNSSNGLYAGQISHYPAATGENETVWFEGTIEGDVSKATNQWTVSGKQFQITDSTAFDARGGLAQDGARVQVEAVNEIGGLQARRVMVLSSGAAADRATLLGTFDGFDDAAGVWRISGVDVLPPASFDIEDEPAAGSLVLIDAQVHGEGLEATAIKIVEEPDGAPLIQLEGTISAIDGSRWTLEIGDVRVPSTARVTGTPDVGKRVMVWVTQGRDGSLEGTYARILDETPITTPAPAPTPTLTPVASQ
jgi:hypothetical protein